jgi:hypothetical protein
MKSSAKNCEIRGKNSAGNTAWIGVLKLHQISMDLLHQVALLFILAIPVACISWTVTHEEVFREPREYFVHKSKHGKNIFIRKFFYLFTCEYCFSHWVTLGALFVTNYQLVYDDWRGYPVGGFSLVWIANVYMTLYSRVRIDIKKDKTEIELDEEQLGKKR